jgi:hypothetical protein
MTAPKPKWDRRTGDITRFLANLETSVQPGIDGLPHPLPGDHFAGVALIWDELTSKGIDFLPGSFNSDPKNVPYGVKPYVWMHEIRHPIGLIRAWETPQGLMFSGRWEPTTEGEKARARANFGSAPQVSVGISYTDPTFEQIMETPADQIIHIAAFQLLEISQVTLDIQSAPSARITSTLMSGPDAYAQGQSSARNLCRLAVTASRKAASIAS